MSGYVGMTRTWWWQSGAWPDRQRLDRTIGENGHIPARIGIKLAANVHTFFCASNYDGPQLHLEPVLQHMDVFVVELSVYGMLDTHFGICACLSRGMLSGRWALLSHWHIIAQLNSNSLVQARCLAYPNPSVDIKMPPMLPMLKAYSVCSLNTYSFMHQAKPFHVCLPSIG